MPFANKILLRPKQFWSVFNEKNLIILKKSEKIVTLTNYFIHPFPCFHLTLNKIPLKKTKNASDSEKALSPVLLIDCIFFPVFIHPSNLDFPVQEDTVYLNVAVVVQFGFWFNFDFPLFFSMLIYDNEYQTMENQN